MTEDAKKIENTSYYTKNIIVADGLVPSIPQGIKLSDKIFHSNDCLHRLEKSFDDYRTESTFIVVGSGQTAIDILTYLRTRYPNATIMACVRGYSYKPQDDSHFVNELFFPKAVDMWYSMPKELKNKMLSYHADVTHSAADIDMLPPLYNSYYMDKATKKNKFHIKGTSKNSLLMPDEGIFCGSEERKPSHTLLYGKAFVTKLLREKDRVWCEIGIFRGSLKRFHELISATEKNGTVKAIFLDRYKGKGTVSIEGCALILATGYKRPMPINCLSGLNDYLDLNEYGYLFNRDYSVKTTKNISPNIYIQGYAEQSHGFSEILVSLMPVRAKEIMHSIQENLKGEKW